MELSILAETTIQFASYACVDDFLKVTWAVVLPMSAFLCSRKTSQHAKHSIITAQCSICGTTKTRKQSAALAMDFKDFSWQWSILLVPPPGCSFNAPHVWGIPLFRHIADWIHTDFIWGASAPFESNHPTYYTQFSLQTFWYLETEYVSEEIKPDTHQACLVP